MAQAPERGEIEIWGDGKQTRSFLYVDECLDGIRRLMESDFTGPVNIGSEEMVTINQLAELVMDVAGKELSIHHIKGPLGVRGRNSDNKLIFEKLGWRPNRPLREGLQKTYAWVAAQVEKARQGSSGLTRWPSKWVSISPKPLLPDPNFSAVGIDVAPLYPGVMRWRKQYILPVWGPRSV